MRKLILFLCVLIFSGGCLEKFDVPAASKRIVIVDGEVTNTANPRVEIKMSSDIGDFLKYPEPVMNATVRIVDDLGNETTLAPTKAGVYETDGFVGVIGRSYRLEFTTADNKTYVSDFEKMYPPGEMSELRWTFASGAINGDEPLKPQDAITIHTDAKGLGDTDNFFRWRWIETYEVETFPMYRTKSIIMGEESVIVPDPPPCSGFGVSPDYMLVPMGPCTCCHCWITAYGETSQVSNNQYVTQNDFRNIAVAELAVEPRRFAIRYHIEVEQLSLSENVHEFWKNVQAQQQGSRNIFQPNTINITGNIRNIDDPEEKVGGVFSVSAITKKHVFINNHELPVLVRADTSILTCMAAYPGSTNVRPPFW